MVKVRNSEESITLTLPVSIILSSLRKHEERIGLQNKRLPEAIAVIDALKREDYPDGHSIKAAQERVRIWKREHRWHSLLTDLVMAIEANPCPGQHWRLYALAQHLMPQVSKREWYEMFFWFGIQNVAFWSPVEVTELDIETVEKQLLELINDDNVVPAMALTTVLQCSPNGKQYRTAKEKLTQRGWRWAHQRSGLTTQRVIRPPELAAWVQGQ
jgi:hypothetical protein